MNDEECNDKKEGDKMTILARSSDKMKVIDKDKVEKFKKESKENAISPEFLSKCQGFSAMCKRKDENDD